MRARAARAIANGPSQDGGIIIPRKGTQVRMTDGDEHSEGNASIHGLAASGPAKGLEQELMLFGRFIGDWEILERRYQLDDGSWRSTAGEIHWGWILGGRAIQDVWIAYERETGRLDQYGTTVRFYDTDMHVWRSTWISAIHNTVMEFAGGESGRDIVLECKDHDEEIIRWIFYDIGDKSFRWRAETSMDGGGGWTTKMEMRVRRIA